MVYLFRFSTVETEEVSDIGNRCGSSKPQPKNLLITPNIDIMNDFIVLGVLPGAAAIFGFVVGGPVGGFLGLFLAFILGVLGLYTEGDSDDRVEELEQEVKELQRELDEKQ